MARAMRRRSTSRGANLAAWLYTFGAVAILAASTGFGDHSVVEFLSAFSQFFSFAAWGYFAYRVARWFLPTVAGVRRPPPPSVDEEEEPRPRSINRRFVCDITRPGADARRVAVLLVGAADDAARPRCPPAALRASAPGGKLCTNALERRRPRASSTVRAIVRSRRARRRPSPRTAQGLS